MVRCWFGLAYTQRGCGQFSGAFLVFREVYNRDVLVQ